jgi:hypothetical protein
MRNLILAKLEEIIKNEGEVADYNGIAFSLDELKSLTDEDLLGVFEFNIGFAG